MPNRAFKTSQNSNVFYVRRPPQPTRAKSVETFRDPDDCPCVHVLQPLLTYMKIFGLNYTFCRPALRPFFKIYCAAVLILQCLGVLRYISHINPSQEGLNVTTTLKIVSIIYFSIGALSSFVLIKLQHHMLPIRNAIVRELPVGSELPGHDSLLRTSKIFVAVTAFVSTINILSLIMTRLGLVAMPAVPAFTYPAFPYFLIDSILVFVTQSSIMMCGSVFAIFCLAIRKSVMNIASDMHEDAYRDDVFQYQKHYLALTNATALLEERYSYYILYIYATQVPMACFIFYTILRGSNLDFGAICILAFWALGIIEMLLFISITPILLYEQGDDLKRSSYQMYDHIDTKANPMQFQQSIQFLVSQVNSTPLSISAGNMFILTREMLLAMFSQILTYFIILLQSG